MYCHNCNSYNSDDSRFCSQCGTALNPYSNGQTQYGGNQYGSQNFGKPMYNNGSNHYTEPTPAMTVTTPIIAIIVNVIFPNILALIFGILSLVNFNRYENDLRSGNIVSAELNKQRSKKYAKTAIILAIVLAILEIVAISCFMALGFVSGAEILDGEIMEGFALISKM